MASSSVYFNGKQLTIPNVYAAMDSSMTTSKTSSSTAKIIALIGECEGGEPEAVQFFSEPSVAKQVLKRGDLLKAAQKAWNPVSKTKEGLDIGGADIIACIRSNKAVKATTLIPQGLDTTSSFGSMAYSISPVSTVPVITVNEAGSTYKGTKNETIRISVIKGANLADQDQSIKVAWRYESEKAFHDQVEVFPKIPVTPSGDGEGESGEETPSEDTTVRYGAEYKALKDATGISVKFAESGIVTDGDYVLIPCTAATSKTDSKYTVSAKDWGKSGNSIGHSMADGTVTGTKKFTVYNSSTDSYETYNNLGAAFSIQYTGSEPYAAISIISNGEGKAIKLQTYKGNTEATAQVDLDVDLSTRSYRSIKALVSFLSSYEGYKVTLSEYANLNLSVSDLDFCDRRDIKSESFKVTAFVMDLANQLQRLSDSVEIVDINRESIHMTNYSLTPLAGGSEGSSPSSWEKYFKALGRYPVYYITPLTDDLSIIAECAAHCEEMSETFGRERRMIAAGSNKMSVAQAIESAKKINSSRAQYVYPGFYDMNEDGELELYPAYILAAQHAGRVAFLPAGEAATHDIYRMAACEYELDPQQVKELLAAGVVTFSIATADDIYSAASVLLVQDLTTNTDSNNVLDTERAVGALADNINKTIRDSLEFVSTGKRGNRDLMTSVKTKVLGVLQKKKDDEEIVDYKDVTVTRKSGVTYVEYSVAPTTPNNFTLVQGHMYDEEITV